MTDLRIRVTAIAAVLAPALVLASTVAYLARGEGMNDGEVGGAIQLWGMAAYAVAVVGLLRLVEDAAPRAAVVLTVLAMLGVAAGAGYGIDSMQVELFGTDSIQEVEGSLAPIALQVPGILFPVSLIGLGVVLARTGTVTALAGYGLAVGAVLFPASRIPDVPGLAVASDVIVLLALAAIAAQVVRRPVSVAAMA